MKKSAVVAIVLSMLTTQAWAYENLQAGYSVQDKNPYYKVESNKVYGFSNISATSLEKLEKMHKGSVHIVNYYTAEDMKEIIGEDFSTEYFNKQYDKLAVLQQSALNLNTVPMPLLQMDKYKAFQAKGNPVVEDGLLQEENSKLEPTVRIDKFNGHKAITLSWLFRRNNSLVNAEATLVSANDRLYLLSTVSGDTQTFAPKTEPAPKDAAGDIDDEIETSDSAKVEATAPIDAEDLNVAMHKVMAVTAIAPKDVDVNILKDFWKVHTKFVKGFKVLTPQDGERKLVYTDNITKKTVALPNDWFYAQLNSKNKNADFALTIATSITSMKKMAADLDVKGLFKIIADNRKVQAEHADPATGEIPPLTAKQVQEINNKMFSESDKVLNAFESFLVTSSMKMHDKELQQDFKEILSNQLATEAFLDDSLTRLQSWSNNYFALKNYSYTLNFTPEKAIMDIKANTAMLDKYDFTNFMRLTCNNDIATMLLYTKKADLEQQPEIAKSISGWQF